MNAKISGRVNLAAAAALAVALLCIALQVRRVEKSSARASEVEPQVLAYLSEIRPETSVCFPGGKMFFRARWKIMLHGRPAMPILVFSSLVNEADGTNYPMITVPHVIGYDGFTDGVRERRIQRAIPANIEPGKYRLVGWAETHTDRIRQSARFRSEPFEVRAP